jgi:hypothetical protein
MSLFDAAAARVNLASSAAGAQQAAALELAISAQIRAITRDGLLGPRGVMAVRRAVSCLRISTDHDPA